MVKSMTGFGRGEYLGEDYNFHIEMKAVNHRYNDIVIRMPRYLSFLEDRIKKKIKEKIHRGRVDVFINLEYMDDRDLKVNVDIDLAKASMKALELIKSELEIKEEIKMSDLLRVNDSIKIEREISDENRIWISLEEALDNALEDLLSMKEEEGIALESYMLSGLKSVEELLIDVEKRVPNVVLEQKEKLKERISELLKDEYTLDDEKIANEIAFFADKSDISEEVSRLYSHLNQFKLILKEEGAIGRKLDFLIQEINREINTIGSKSADEVITQRVVEMKSEIEKIREQVQNVE